VTNRSETINNFFFLEMTEENTVDNEHTALNNTFSALGLDEWLIQALAAISIKRPTPIQAACIHPILEGKNFRMAV
jgi:superfamily II DNA/RNA helicase